MKHSDWMTGLLYAESESKRLQDKNLSFNEITNHLKWIIRQEILEGSYNRDWVQGVSDFKQHYKENIGNE